MGIQSRGEEVSFRFVGMVVTERIKKPDGVSGQVDGAELRGTI